MLVAQNLNVSLFYFTDKKFRRVCPYPNKQKFHMDCLKQNDAYFQYQTTDYRLGTLYVNKIHLT